MIAAPSEPDCCSDASVMAQDWHLRQSSSSAWGDPGMQVLKGAHLANALLAWLRLQRVELLQHHNES